MLLPVALQWSAAATSLASNLAAMRCSAESRLVAAAQPAAAQPAAAPSAAALPAVFSAVAAPP
eukprot:scaffold2460_cov18-Phaeocystis_antarctica.AAC.1